MSVRALIRGLVVVLTALSLSSAFADQTRLAIIDGIRQAETLPKKEQAGAFLALATKYSDLSLGELLEISNALRNTYMNKLQILNRAIDRDLDELFAEASRVLDQVSDSFYQKHKNTLDAHSVVLIAKNTGTTQLQNKILEEFSMMRNSSLSADESIELAKATSTGELQDKLLEYFSTSNLARISPSEATALGKATSSGKAQDRILRAFSANKDRRKMSVTEALELAQATSSGKDQDQILVEYFDGVSALTTNEALALAKATSSGKIQDQILLKFVDRFFLNDVSSTSEDALRLAQATSSGGAQDQVLVQFSRRRKARLTVAELQTLAKASSSGAAEREIESLIKSK